MQEKGDLAGAFTDYALLRTARIAWSFSLHYFFMNALDKILDERGEACYEKEQGLVISSVLVKRL